MNIKAFPIKVTKDEAERIAQKKGGLLWRIIFSGKDIGEIRQHFIEFKLITFEAVYRPGIFERTVLKKTAERRQKIVMLANGSSGSAAWVQDLPEVVSLEKVDKNNIQLSDREDEYLVGKCRKVALRVMHRFVGGIPELEVKSIESVYRPYWIALYGQVVNGSKVRYMPIPADGCSSQRSF